MTAEEATRLVEAAAQGGRDERDAKWVAAFAEALGPNSGRECPTCPEGVKQAIDAALSAGGDEPFGYGVTWEWNVAGEWIHDRHSYAHEDDVETQELLKDLRAHPEHYRNISDPIPLYRTSPTAAKRQALEELTQLVHREIGVFQDIIGWQPGESRNKFVCEIRDAVTEKLRQAAADLAGDAREEGT